MTDMVWAHEVSFDPSDFLTGYTSMEEEVDEDYESLLGMGSTYLATGIAPAMFGASQY